MSDLKAKWIRLHGFFTPGGNPCYKCSNCGYETCPPLGKTLPERCPVCDAKMEEKGDQWGE